MYGMGWMGSMDCPKGCSLKALWTDLLCSFLELLLYFMHMYRQPFEPDHPYFRSATALLDTGWTYKGVLPDTLFFIYDTGTCKIVAKKEVPAFYSMFSLDPAMQVFGMFQLFLPPHLPYLGKLPEGTKIRTMNRKWPYDRKTALQVLVPMLWQRGQRQCMQLKYSVHMFLSVLPLQPSNQ